jgi:hypothetical protein
VDASTAFFFCVTLGLRHPFDRLRAGCEPLSLAGTAGLGSYSFAPAAINGFSHRHPYGAICVPDDPIVTDRLTVIAAMRTSARS